jgi:hypothetical protein
MIGAAIRYTEITSTTTGMMTGTCNRYAIGVLYAEHGTVWDTNTRMTHVERAVKLVHFRQVRKRKEEGQLYIDRQTDRKIDR